MLLCGTDSPLTSLSAHIPEIGTAETVGELDDGLEVNVAILRDLRRVDLQDLHIESFRLDLASNQYNEGCSHSHLQA